MQHKVERHRRVMELLEQVLCLPENDRAALIDRVVVQEPALGSELLALAAVDTQNNDFLGSIDGRIDVTELAGSRAEPVDVGVAGECENGETECRDHYLEKGIAERYRIDALLGTGGMGRVYRAFDMKLARDVAIKFLRSDLVPSARQVQRFRREFRAVSQIDHSGCVAVFEEGCVQDQRYIVMEYVAGGNLERLSRAGEDVLLPILIKLTETLDSLHVLGILHRDIKPANVLLTAGDFPTPKLADFGIVHMIDDVDGRLTEPGAMVGSIDFMSPEQIECKKLDPRSDLYSLGCSIYTLWTGQSPFQGSFFQRLRARVESEAPLLRALAPRAPERLEVLVARLLRRDRTERPERAIDVARELSAVQVDHRVRNA